MFLIDGKKEDGSLIWNEYRILVHLDCGIIEDGFTSLMFMGIEEVEKSSKSLISLFEGRYKKKIVTGFVKYMAAVTADKSEYGWTCWKLSEDLITRDIPTETQCMLAHESEIVLNLRS